MSADYIITSTDGNLWANNHIVASSDAMNTETIEGIQKYLWEKHGREMIIVSIIKLDAKTKHINVPNGVIHNELARIYSEALKVVRHYARNSYASSEMALQFLRENGMGEGDLA